MTQASGDGWAQGPGGIKLWGRYGAAGLYLLAGDRVLLQHRAAWTSQGDTWGIPGGARDFHETPEEAALRETVEECGIDKRDVEVLGAEVTAGPYPGDGWTYTTVVAHTRDGEPLATVANEESAELRWVALDEVEELDLLPPFRAALPQIAELVQRVGHITR